MASLTLRDLRNCERLTHLACDCQACGAFSRVAIEVVGYPLGTALADIRTSCPACGDRRVRYVPDWTSAVGPPLSRKVIIAYLKAEG